MRSVTVDESSPRKVRQCPRCHTGQTVSTQAGDRGGEVAPRVVVTGATGFIGRALVRRLRRESIPVLAVVRAERATTRDDGVRYVARDLERTDTLRDVLHEGDVIVHLAGRAHVLRGDDASADAVYRQANVAPTQMLCESAVASGVRRVVFLSSAKVFGEGRDLPYRRSDPPRPVDAYARSKHEAEQVVRDVAGSSGMEWTIMRPPFVYGAGGKGNFPRLVTLARLSTFIPMPLASIANRRSVVFVENLVDAIVRCGFHGAAAGHLLLPTDAHEVSTPELLRAIAATRSRRARLFSLPPAMLRFAASLVGRSGEMERLTESLRLDSRHLAEELGWYPPFTLQEALELSLSAHASMIERAVAIG